MAAVWLAENWWLVWGLVVVTGLVIYRVQRRGSEEPLLRRLKYVLIPAIDPRNRNRPQLTLIGLVVLVIGLVIILAELLLVAVLNR